jgi:hypothetical protein
MLPLKMILKTSSPTVVPLRPSDLLLTETEAQRDSLISTSMMRRMLKTLSRNQERSLMKETLELIMLIPEEEETAVDSEEEAEVAIPEVDPEEDTHPLEVEAEVAIPEVDPEEVTVKVAKVVTVKAEAEKVVTVKAVTVKAVAEKAAKAVTAKAVAEKVAKEATAKVDPEEDTVKVVKRKNSKGESFLR